MHVALMLLCLLEQRYASLLAVNIFVQQLTVQQNDGLPCSLLVLASMFRDDVVSVSSYFVHAK